MMMKQALGKPRRGAARKGVECFAVGLTLGAVLVGCGEIQVEYDTNVLSVCMEPEVSTSPEIVAPANSRIAVGWAGTGAFQGEVHEWQAELPDNRVPGDTNDVDIVVCVDEGRTVLKECDYTGGLSLRSEKYDPQIFVYDAESGAGLASASFQGSSPKRQDCPFSYPQSDDDWEGPLPTQDFLDWIEVSIP